MAAIQHFRDVAAGLEQIDRKILAELARDVRDAAKRGGTVWIAGNGGSFATAQHWAADLSKVARIKAFALGSNPALLTAFVNDYNRDDMFALEFVRCARTADLLICLSCSGISSNISHLIGAAIEMDVRSWLLTGTMKDHVAQADQILRIWSRDYGVIEDCHSAIGHWLAKELAK